MRFSTIFLLLFLKSGIISSLLGIVQHYFSSAILEYGDPKAGWTEKRKWEKRHPVQTRRF